MSDLSSDKLETRGSQQRYW